MSSRYDISLFWGITIAQFMQAYAGVPTSGRGDSPDGTAVAQIDTDRGPHVVLIPEPMRRPEGVDARLAQALGVEALFATVWDSVSHYSMTVMGPGIDRHISSAPDEDPAAQGKILVEQSGAPLSEEPSGTDLSEAYLQTVCMARYGLYPGRVSAYPTTWYSLAPGQAAGSAQAVPPMQTQRSKPKLIIGIVLTVFGGLMLLGQMAAMGNGTASAGGGSAYMLGRLFGFALMVLVPLAIGILLIATSKKSPSKR